MANPHPANLNIEIDRVRLRRYLRAKSFLSWVAPLSFFGGLFGFASVGKSFDKGGLSPGEILGIVSVRISVGVCIALLLASLCYFVFSHRAANRRSAALEVTVEGAFLRIREDDLVVSDRKLHFRSIVDYSTYEDFLMRYFGVSSLRMATTAGGHQGWLMIPGVKDCLRVRDLLAEIDSQRENG
jgi:hypothetical protein